jgi:hypothetical protein
MRVMSDPRRKQASTLPADGRSEDGMVSVHVKTIDLPAEPINVHIKTVDVGDVPPFLDRCKSRTA